MFDPTVNHLSRYLDTVSFRQKLVASNIANADTPDYKTKDIDFASELKAASGIEGFHVVEASGLQIKNDGNNVSLDREARLLAENALRFNMASNLLKSQLRMVKTAINEGR